MIDVFEQKFGPVEDRSIFYGEIVVPPHLRNVSLTSIRANRFANGSLFGSVPRSRTLFSLPPNARHSMPTFHGSVPDLSRHSSPFTTSFNHNTSNNTFNSIDSNDDGGRRLSSASTIPETITKITLNTSTTLALTNINNRNNNNNNLKNYPPSNGNANHLTNHGKNAHAIESIDEHTDDDYKSNSIRSLNDIQLREKSCAGNEQDRALYCQSLGRPIRNQKLANQQRLRSQPQSLDAYNSEGYMTLIKTNVAPVSHGRYQQRSSINRAVSPTMNNDGHTSNTNSIQMAASTSTFQRKAAAPLAPVLMPVQVPPPPSVTNKLTNQPRSPGVSQFANEFSLNDFTNFKLPRVTLNHSTVTNPQQ